jgi:hypothetical protein
VDLRGLEVREDLVVVSVIAPVECRLAPPPPLVERHPSLSPRAPSAPGRAGDAERVARGLHTEFAVMGIDGRHARLPSLAEVASRSISSIMSTILL